jgi:hypothetical protein
MAVGVYGNSFGTIHNFMLYREDTQKERSYVKHEIIPSRTGIRVVAEYCRPCARRRRGRWRQRWWWFWRGSERRQRWCDGQQQFGLDLRFSDHQFRNIRNDRKRYQFFWQLGAEHEPEFKYDGQSKRSK